MEQHILQAGEIVKFFSYISQHDKTQHEGVVTEVMDVAINEVGTKRIKYIIQPLDAVTYGFEGLIDRFHPYDESKPTIADVILDGVETMQKPTPTQNKAAFELTPPERDIPNVLDVEA